MSNEVENQLITFDVFYSNYPLKQARKTAKKAWDKLNPSQELALRIIEGVKKHAAYNKKWLDGFIPMPSTFLNQERWMDEGLVIPKRPSEAPQAPRTQYIPGGYKDWLEYEKAHTESRESLLEAIREKPEKFKWFVLPFIRLCPTSIRGEVEKIYGIGKTQEIETSKDCPY